MLHLSEEKLQEVLEAKRIGKYRYASSILFDEITEMYIEDDYSEFLAYTKMKAQCDYLYRAVVQAKIDYAAIIVYHAISNPDILDAWKNNSSEFKAFVNTWAPDVGYACQKQIDTDYYNALAGNFDPSKRKSYRMPDNSFCYCYYDPMKYFNDGLSFINDLFSNVNPYDCKTQFRNVLSHGVANIRNVDMIKHSRALGKACARRLEYMRSRGLWK